MHFFQLFGDKCTRDESKMFSLQMMSEDKLTEFGKIVLKF